MDAAGKTARRIPKPCPKAPERAPGSVADHSGRETEKATRRNDILAGPDRVAPEDQLSPALHSEESVADHSAPGCLVEGDIAPTNESAPDRFHLDLLAVPNRRAHAVPVRLKSDRQARREKIPANRRERGSRRFGNAQLSSPRTNSGADSSGTNGSRRTGIEAERSSKNPSVKSSASRL